MFLEFTSFDGKCQKNADFDGENADFDGENAKFV